MAVMRAIAPLRWCQISAATCGPASSPARLRARSTASIRRQPAPAAAAREKSTRPRPPHRYQRRKPRVRLSIACAWACALVSGSKTCAAAALRWTGPMVRRGRSGPWIRRRGMSSSVLPICTSCAGPERLRVGVRAPTDRCWPSATTSCSGVSATVTGTPMSRQNATSSTVGQARSSRSTPGRRGATAVAGGAWGDDFRTGHPRPTACWTGSVCRVVGGPSSGPTS